MHGKEPTDLPDISLRSYDTGVHTVIAASTGPGEGLTAVKRSRAHLTLGDDIDFIDTAIEEPDERKSVPKPELSFRTRYHQQFRQRLNKDTQEADQNANKTTIDSSTRPRKLSKSETKEETTKIHQLKTEKNASGTINVIVSMISTKPATNNVNLVLSRPQSDNYNKNVEIPKENISPNDNVKQNDNKDFIPNDIMTASMNCNTIASPDEYAGICNWKMETENAYGLSVSLYEKNYITQESTGNPIADCYGVVMRGNSIAMALADGVNWGKVSICLCVVLDSLRLFIFRRRCMFGSSISRSRIIGLPEQSGIRSSGWKYG